MKKINWKRFAIGLLIFLPAFLLLDVLYDLVFKTLIWSDTFALKNLLFKILAAIVAAYFYATYKNDADE
jgi:hypothetical protein